MPTGFDRISAYDYPEVIFSQVFDGEFAPPTTLYPTMMTPEERDTLRDKMKKAAGPNGFTDFLIDVALNPFVLFGLGLSHGTLPKAGRVFDTAAKHSAQVNKQGGLLKILGLLGGNQTLEGTTAKPLLNQILQRMGLMKSDYLNIVQLAEARVARSLGVSSLDSQKSGKVAKLMALIDADLNGMVRGYGDPDKIVRQVPFLKQKVEREVVDGVKKKITKYEIGVKEVQQLRPLNRDAVESFYDQVDGARELRAAYREYADRMLMETMGKGSGFTGFDGKIVPYEQIKQMFDGDWLDADGKVLALYRALAKPKHQRDVMGVGGIEMLTALVQGPVAKAVSKGDLSLEQFSQLLKSATLAPINRQAYSPRNFYVRLNSTGERVLGSADEFAQANKALQGSKAGAPRFARFENRYDLEDLNRLKDFANEDFDEVYRLSEGFINDAIKDNRSPLLLKLDAREKMFRHYKNGSRTVAVHTDVVQPATIAAQRKYQKDIEARLTKEYGENWRDNHEFQYRSTLNSQRGLPITEPMDAVDGVPPGGFRVGDGLYSSWKLMTDDGRNGAKDVMGRILIPAALGNLKYHDLPGKAAFMYGQKMTKSFLGSKLAEALRTNPKSAKLISGLEKFVDADEPQGYFFSGPLMRYFYNTHLGLNPGTVTLNASQPFITTAPMIGIRNVVEGYPAAVAELHDYVDESMRFIRDNRRLATQAEKAEMIKRNFKYADTIGIGPSAMEAMESRVLQETLGSARPGKWDSLERGMLWAFEKGEWTNRNATAHAVRRKWINDGLEHMVDTPEMLAEMEQVVQQTQFASSVMSTPIRFLDPSSTLSNPLARQFLTFPTKFLGMVFHDAARLGGETNDIKGIWNFVLRGGAYSAIAYETMKHTFGADLQRGLFLGPMADLADVSGVGGIVPLPPAIDLPLSTLIGLTQGDTEQLRRDIPRLVPGGVAISRAMGLLPEGVANVPLVGEFQRTYVDWSARNEEGLVPQYKRDGTLVGYFEPKSAMFKAMGVDASSQFSDEAKMTNYLVKQRDQILDYRRRYIKAMVGNQMNEAQKIAAEFQKRFKVPLTVSKAQLKSYLDLRRIPRVDRVLSRMPSEVRPMYAAELGRTLGQNLGVPASRVAFGLGHQTPARISNAQLPPEVVGILEQIAGGNPSPRPAEAESSRSFVPFSAF